MAIRRVFISFLNDDNKQQDTFCELVEESVNYVKIQIGLNLITLPYSRVLKIKEAVRE
jgi:arabinogalactan endo-1,4-beta-galactosidase